MKNYDLNELLEEICDNLASDLHIGVGIPPMMRVDTVIRPMGETVLTKEMAEEIIYSVLSNEQIERFEKQHELDASFPVKSVGRVRLNVYRQRGSIGAAMRFLPNTTKTFEDLGLPKIIYDIVDLPKGLVLITGATGSGKTTSLASMINYINENRNGHIITIEDPIEYLHQHKNCIVTQREVGSDTESFAGALRYVLRQDPDIILIGEMRDYETMAAAVTLAETGHLVFATLHTMDATSSINRIIDSFPAHQQPQIRTQLSMTLKAVISQQLLPHFTGKGMVLISEVLIIHDSVKSIIRDSKIEQIYSVIQTGKQWGMHTMNQSIYEAVISNRISRDVAYNYSTKKEELERLLTSMVKGR
jgi:twitching motility protein PilT